MLETNVCTVLVFMPLIQISTIAVFLQRQKLVLKKYFEHFVKNKRLLRILRTDFLWYFYLLTSIFRCTIAIRISELQDIEMYVKIAHNKWSKSIDEASFISKKSLICHIFHIKLDHFKFFVECFLIIIVEDLSEYLFPFQWYHIRPCQVAAAVGFL